MLRKESEEKEADLNLYGFVLNNPVNRVDVYGLTDYYKNIPKPTAADAIGVVKHFLDYFNAVSLSQEAMYKIREIEMLINCNKKEKAHVCFVSYPSPHNVTVGRGSVITSPNKKCKMIWIQGKKDCCYYEPTNEMIYVKNRKTCCYSKEIGIWFAMSPYAY